MQNIEQFGEERHEIKLLRTCVSYFLLFQKMYILCLSFKICLTKIVYVDTSFTTDTDVTLIEFLGTE